MIKALKYLMIYLIDLLYDRGTTLEILVKGK